MSEETAPIKSTPKLLGEGMLLPFMMIAILFPLWGFANDITNPMVKVFKDIFLISNTQSSLVQLAFYLGYGIMALPAAIFIRRFSYKAGIILGLALYAIGALCFLPASSYQEFNYFLIALCVLTFGLALLETTANPCILSMGDPATATKRLNLAQSFNPLGSLTGMFIASTMILSKLKIEAFRQSEKIAHPEYKELLPSTVDEKLTQALHNFATNHPIAHKAMQATDLATVRGPYIAIAIVVSILLMAFVFVKFPKTNCHENPLTVSELGATLLRLFKNRCYLEGVVAQGFYVGAQIMVWTFVIHYGMTVAGLSASDAQNYNIIAMGIFLATRLICTFLLGFICPGKLLQLLASTAIIMTTLTIFLNGMPGMYSLIGISACMSLMFPTIYGIALSNLGDDASIGSAGLIMAIVGGALMPPMQGALIDKEPLVSGLTSVQTSFILPLICFVVIAFYGYRVSSTYNNKMTR